MFPQIAPAAIQFRGLTPYDRYPWFQAATTQTQVWTHLVYANGGTLLYSEIQLAENYLALPITRNATLLAGMVSLYPFIGASVAAAACPLFDVRCAGAAYNSNEASGFTTANIGTNVGLITAGANNSKWFDTGLTPNIVAASGFVGNPVPAGCFWYERNGTFGTTFVEPMGCYSPAGTERYSMDLRSNLQAGRWCTTAANPSVASTATNSDYYLEASATNLRTLYKDGTSIATNTSATSTAGSIFTMTLGGCRTNTSTVTGYGPGRCGVAGWTGGAVLGSTGAAALHTILAAFCTAAGR